MKRIFGIIVVVVLLFLLAGSSCVLAQKKNSSSSPPKAAPTPHSNTVPPQRPGGGAAPSSGGVRGPSTSGPHGPTTSRPGSGPTTSGPGKGGHGGSGGVGASGTGGAGVDKGHSGGGPSGSGAGSGGGITTSSGRTEPAGIGGKPAPRGAQSRTFSDGSAIQRRANGHISDVHDPRRGVTVHEGLAGRRSVVAERPGGARIFAERGRPGYVSHPFSLHGHDFARRTYYYRGHAYSRFYRPYRYGGVMIDVYNPSRYYPFDYYGWAYGSWGGHVMYAWGWRSAPWAGYYGYYFAPSAFYPSASFWLTDYMLSQDLAADYQAAQDSTGLAAEPDSSNGPELSSDVKQQIANEVAGQIALEYNEAQQSTQNQNDPQNIDPDPRSSSIERLLTDGRTHAFVVGNDLDLVDNSGTECAVSGGDVLELTSPPPADANAADLVVLASKGASECPKADTVTVAFSDLQEMQNHMRETVDQGLDELRAKQGTGGLPAAPASAQQPYTDTTVAQFAPPPDPSAGAEIDQQTQQADAAEREVPAEAQQQGTSAPPSQTAPPAQAAGQPVNISLGQSTGEITSALGQPLQIINLGAKTIYRYQDIKITFVNGKVTDVE